MDKAQPLPNQEAGDRATAMQTVQSHAGVLMRYHSAPSSVLASLLYSEDGFCKTAPQVEDSELARVCMSSSLLNMQSAAENANGCITAYNSHAPQSLSSSIPSVTSSASAIFPQQYVESRTSGHLCSIFKHTQIDPSAKFQSSLQNAENSMSLRKLSMPASLPSLSQPFLSTKSNLIRHSSFPAEILSRLAADESREGPLQQVTGSSVQHNFKGVRDMHTVAESIPYDKLRVTHVDAGVLNDSVRAAHIPHGRTKDAHVSYHNTGSTRFPLASGEWPESTRPCLVKGGSFNGKSTIFPVKDETKVVGGETQSMESTLCINGSSLFRQSSLPASLLSQLSFDGPSSGNSSEEDKRSGGSRFTSRVSGFWDEAGGGSAGDALGQRKRGREVDDKTADGLSMLGPIQRCSEEEEMMQWSFGGPADVSSGSLLSLDDSVLCRVRAKRGCATHPRSIAERVRRTKISEGMRKLQELVPNQEKQTNTAAMLDEAVEYVKFLQQEVQKLSQSQAKCNGSCRVKGNT